MSIRIDGTYPERTEWRWVLQLSQDTAVRILATAMEIDEEAVPATGAVGVLSFLNKGWRKIPRSDMDYEYMRWLALRLNRKPAEMTPPVEEAALALYRHDDAWWLLEKQDTAVVAG